VKAKLFSLKWLPLLIFLWSQFLIPPLLPHRAAEFLLALLNWTLFFRNDLQLIAGSFVGARQEDDEKFLGKSIMTTTTMGRV
jgi:hypothetical protein